MSHSTKVYPYRVKSHGRATILLWYSSKRGDFFLTGPEGELLSASSVAQLQQRMRGRSEEVQWKEGAELNLDAFWRALGTLNTKAPSPQKTCRLLLNGWNFVEDLLRTLGLNKERRRLRSRELNRCYDKIFFGSNLPSVTPKSKRFEPLWTERETMKLKDVFGEIRRCVDLAGLVT